MQRRRDHHNPFFLQRPQRRDQFNPRNCDVKQRALGGAHAFFIVDIGAVGRKQHLIETKRHRRTDDRSDVAGILHPIQRHNPRIPRFPADLLRTDGDQPGAGHIGAELAHDALAADDRFLFLIKRICPASFDQQQFNHACFQSLTDQMFALDQKLTCLITIFFLLELRPVFYFLIHRGIDFHKSASCCLSHYDNQSAWKKPESFSIPVSFLF